MTWMLAVMGLALAAGLLGIITGLAVGIEAERKRLSPYIRKPVDKEETEEQAG